MITLDSLAGAVYDLEDPITVDIDFIASSSEDIVIPIERRIREVLRGRLYIDVDPSAPFTAWVTISFYNKLAMKGEDAFYRTQAKLVYTELEVATTGTDADIIPDDHTDFSPNDLAVILDSPIEIIRLSTIANTMIAEDNILAHAINIGLARIAEFSGFFLYNNEDANNVYLRVGFSSSQTVSLKMELILRK